MTRLMQILQETQTVSDPLEIMEGKEDLDLEADMAMLDIGRGRPGDTGDEGRDVVFARSYAPDGLEEHPLFSLRAMGYQ